VVGNYKGGCGKSTIAMHLIVALLKAGHRVASFDLDVQQQTLTRYIENRREWARHNALPLELPEHAVLADPGEGDGTDYVGLFTARLATLQNACDFIVIDTAGNASDLSLVAHGMADTLVTPLNDSFLDLDVIVAIGAGASAAPAPSHYAKAVAAALEGRRAVCGRATDWIVLRNRLAPFPSRNHRQITHVLDLVAPALGFRIAPGLAERPVFREFFPFGLTAFDQVHEPALDAGPGMSHVMARMEVRELVEEIGILASAPSIALDHVSGEELLSVP
jgi:chromosome partitioning protein